MIEMTQRVLDEEDLYVLRAAGALGDKFSTPHLVERLRCEQANQQSDAERDRYDRAIEIDP